MRKNYRFVKELVKLRLSHIMIFRLGFFGPFFVDSSLFLIQLFVFQSIYAHVDQIGGWNQGDMILFVGTFSLINALNMIIFFFGILTIPHKIRTGEMDLYLTKPVNPLLRITFEKVNPGSLPLLVFSICIIAYGVNVSGYHLTLITILSYLGMVILMTILWYDMEVLIRIISFFIISTSNIEKVESTAIDLCMKVPGVAFQGIYKFIFYVILPYGIMATFPTQLLIGKLSVGEIMFGIAIVILFTIFTMVLWKWGLKHYDSASS